MSYVFNIFTGTLDIIGGTTSWLAPVTNFAALPGSGNNSGDVRIALDTGIAWEWNGSSWQLLNIVQAAAVGSSPNVNGISINTTNNTITLQPADATHPGVVTTGTQTIAGQKTFSTGITTGSIDNAGTLALGTGTATSINIGNAGATVNIQGTVITETTSTLNVTNPVFTVNSGAGAGSASNSGMQVNENNIITGYVETSADRNSWILKAPNTAGVATVTPGAGGITLNQSSHNPVTIGTANGLSLSTQALSLAAANTSTTGALSSTDWNTFNNKQNALTFGNLTDAGTDGITVTGGTGSVIGSGTSISQHVADSTHNGYLSSTDWTTFNNKQSTVSFTTPAAATDSNGGTITSGAIALEYADGTHPGIVSTGAQTFAGTKTFSSTISGSISGNAATVTTNANLTGDVTSVGNATTLATVNVSPGTTTLSTITTNGKGLVTSNSSASTTGSGNVVLATSPTLVTPNLGTPSTLVGTNITGTASGLTAGTVTTNANLTGVVTSVGNATSIAAGAITNTMLANGAVANLSGTNSGDITLTAVGAAPSANGATLSGQALTLQPADATHPGVVTTGAQTFAGAKTFSSTIVGSINGNAATVTTNANLTGDVTSVGNATTLATVNSNVGSFGSNTGIPSFTVNGKGLITAASNNSVVTSPTASTITAWDANKNLSANNHINGYRTQATAASTLTLTVSDAFQQFFTGTTAGQIVQMPVTSTLVNGMSYLITNNSTQNITVNSSGSNQIAIVAANTSVVFTVINTGVTTAAGWSVSVLGAGGAVMPTIQKFTSSSGTYTTPAGAIYLRVRMVGGGGGGGGSGTAATTGGTGGNTTFGTSLLTANGGAGGQSNTNGGTGGTASLGTGPIGTVLTGGVGQGGTVIGVGGGTYSIGGSGAASPFGGAGGGGAEITTGYSASLNTGSGGGGAGSPSPGNAGAGGGAGGYVDAIINSPSSTYSYAVGAAGTAGTAGTSGAGGGTGGSGYIEVTEYYANGAIGTATTITGTISSSNVTSSTFTPPTVQKFTSGSSATYTTPTSPRTPLYIVVEVQGGGGQGGGGANGSNNAAAGSNGNNSTWLTAGASTIVLAPGGSGGATIGVTGSGSLPTINSPAITLVSLASAGTTAGMYNQVDCNGSQGASSVFGGGGGGSSPVSNGSAANANTGAGGGGGGGSTGVSGFGGSGGACGAYAKVMIPSPAATYLYTVGAAVTSTNNGTNGGVGGSGAAGIIIVTEYYQ